MWSDSVSSVDGVVEGPLVSVGLLAESFRPTSYSFYGLSKVLF